MIATDGGTGLHGALQIVYPKTLLQRRLIFLFHFVQDVSGLVSPAAEVEVVAKAERRRFTAQIQAEGFTRGG